MTDPKTPHPEPAEQRPEPAEGRTTAGMVRLYEATYPQLSALGDVIAPHAARRPATRVPAGLIADARALLAPVRRLVSRQRAWRGRLELSATASWAELDVKLRLARAACEAFRRRHYFYDDDSDEYAWHLRARSPHRALRLIEQQIARLEESDA